LVVSALALVVAIVALIVSLAQGDAGTPRA
jgi:hypothetical protein